MAQKLVTLAAQTVSSPGTAQQVSIIPTPITTIIFQAHPDNDGRVYVGDSNVASNRGMLLDAGDVWSVVVDMRSHAIDEMILSDWYIDASDGSQIVQIQYMKRR